MIVDNTFSEVKLFQVKPDKLDIYYKREGDQDE